MKRAVHAARNLRAAEHATLEHGDNSKLPLVRVDVCGIATTKESKKSERVPKRASLSLFDNYRSHTHTKQQTHTHNLCVPSAHKVVF